MTVIAQLGCGYWGPNLVRNFVEQPNCRLKWVAEPSAERRNYIETNFPQTLTTDDWRVVLADNEVEAVAIATPAATHADLTCHALRAGKHVLVEKPLAMTTDEVDQIATLAAASGRTVMVGHTFLYNNAVRRLKQMKDAGELGDLNYLYSQRLNLGQIRSDVNAWWNLAPHDVSILLYLMDGELPVAVSAHGLKYIQPNVEDVVFAVLRWANGMAAHIHVSWLDPRKVRTMTLVGSRKMVVYDDISDDKLVVYDKGFDVAPSARGKMDYDERPSQKVLRRWGDVWMPKIDFQEPLKLEIAHFLQSARNRTEPLTGIAHARATVAVLEAGEVSLKNGGNEIAPATLRPVVTRVAKRRVLNPLEAVA
jgi:predicted dehydrogenase